jgi:isovaleryl-CoA dehydrogenase
MLADMATDVEAMRCLAYQLLKEVNALAETEGGRGGIHQRSASALLFAGRALMRVLDLAVQVHGGMGFMWETEINRLYRGGKLLEIGAGTTQIRQLIVAGELLKG